MRRSLVPLRWVVIVAVAALLYLFVSRVDAAKLAGALDCARMGPIVLAGALLFGIVWGKATCWHIMLAPRHVVLTRRLFRHTIVAIAASALAPARAGEALRLWLLEQRDGVPIVDGAAVAVGEKVLDGAAMFLLLSPVPWFVPDLPPAIRSVVVVGSVLVAATIVGLMIAARSAAPDARSWLTRFFSAMHVFRSPSRAAAALAALLAAWLIDLAMVELVLFAVGVPLPPAAALVVLLTINLAIIVPATPAQVGIHEAGALAGLALVNVPPEPALAFAIVYHALQIVPVVIVGLALEWRLVLGRAAPLATPEVS